MRAAPLRALCLASLLLAGCATAPKDPAERARFRETNDPLEPLNRRIFAFNQVVDRSVIRPVAQAYVRVLPRPCRDTLRNFCANLGEPVILANDVLQGRLNRAAVTSARFLINSTAGFAGLADIATPKGFVRQTGDFGQTLFVWGVPDGPYLVIPVLGPANLRDAVGQGTDGYLDPFRYLGKEDHFPAWERYGPLIVGGIDERARNLDTLDAVEKDAVDYYASLRSLFRQHRAAQIRGSAAPETGQPGLYDDPDTAPAR